MTADISAIVIGALALAAPLLAAAAAYRVQVVGADATWLTLLSTVAAAAVVAASATGSGPGVAVSVAAITVCALAIAAFDARLFLIPDGLVVSLGALALAAPFAPPPVTQLLGAAALGGLFLGVRLAYRRMRQIDGLGLGDVKLAAAMGLALGPERGLMAVAGAAALAAAWLVLTRQRPVASPDALPARAPAAAPFGVPLALALVAAVAFDLAAPTGATP